MAQNEDDSLKLKFAKFKKYQIPKNLGRQKWLSDTIGFNEEADTLLFHKKYYNLQNFEKELEKILNARSKNDTTLFLLNYGDNLSLIKTYKSFEFLSDHIEKYDDKGVYYFSPYFVLVGEVKKPKSDTLFLHANKAIEYNSIGVKMKDLPSFLRRNKPKLLILKADPNVNVKDVADVYELTKKLKIKTIITTN